MTDVRIQVPDEAHFYSLHSALGRVAAERQFLSLTAAPPLPDSLAFYRDLKRRDDPHFVAVKGDTVLGWVDIAPQFGQARAHIGTLGIALVPEARHMGLGRQLMQAAIDKAWTNRLGRIELSVRADNSNAIALYERCGFVLEGRLRRAHRIDGVDHDVLVMALLAEN